MVKRAVGKANVRKAKKKFNVWWTSASALVFLVAIILFYKALDSKLGGFVSTNATSILIVSALVIIFSGYSLSNFFSKTKKRYLG